RLTANLDRNMAYNQNRGQESKNADNIGGEFAYADQQHEGADVSNQAEKVKAAVGVLTDTAMGWAAKASGYVRSGEAKAAANKVLGRAGEGWSRAGEGAADAAQRTTKAVSSTSPIWKKLARELGASITETANWTSLLFRYAYVLAKTPGVLRK